MRGAWISLRPNDILFFRGSDPFNAGETGYVQSEFPPTPQVMQGAIRTALLEASSVSLAGYAEWKNEGASAGAILEAVGRPGQHDEMGLDLRGPFLEVDGGMYVPAPLDLVSAEDRMRRLSPGGSPTETDIGRVRLPEPEDASVQVSSLAGKWLAVEALTRHLTGDQVEKKSLFDPFASPEGELNHARALAEDKVGLKRNAATLAAEEGMLYTIVTRRLGARLRLLMQVEGIPDECALPEVLSLGGEGRFAWVDTMDMPAGMSAHRDEVARRIDLSGEFRLVFLQPAQFERGWLPDGCDQRRVDGVDCWPGTLRGIDCTLVCACLDKPKMVGGWDIHRGEAKPVHALVPAGSVYFFTTGASGREVVEALDGAKLGGSSRIGFGHCVVGGGQG